MAVIYFDNNATTRLAPGVYEAMQPYLTEYYGNPSSIHGFGRQVSRQIDQAREQVAALIGASSPVEVIFTSGGTEGDNAAIRAVLDAHPEKRHIVTTRVEHPAVLGLCQQLERKGYRVTWLGVDQEGLLDLEELRNSLDDDTAIVSVMYANNETGVTFPIDAVGEIVKSKGIAFHVDAVQAAGKTPLDMKKAQVDLLTISGHKFHGPKGIGALYVRKNITFRPFVVGGHQERNRRGGTENVAGIVGMGAAAELSLGLIGREQHRVRELRDRLEQAVLGACPSSRVNGHRQQRIMNTLNVSFEGLDGEAILVLLDEAGVCTSTGSACTAGSTEPSHVLRAMGVAPAWIQGTVRFSLSRFNTLEEVEFVATTMPKIVERLRGFSGSSDRLEMHSGATYRAKNAKLSVR